MNGEKLRIWQLPS